MHGELYPVEGTVVTTTIEEAPSQLRVVLTGTARVETIPLESGRFST